MRKTSGVAAAYVPCTKDCKEVSLDFESSPQSQDPPHQQDVNETSAQLVKRAPSLTVQLDAGDEMAFLSAYDKTPWSISDFGGDFVYDSSAGEGSVVYMIDTVSQ